jgi:energy-coupling factor transport system substrate-specific component
MTADKKNYFKVALIFVLCLLARLIPFRMPNVEPILAATMPIGRVSGAFLGFSFAILSILLFDVITGTLGVQTFFTALSYGLIALWSVSYFKKREGTAFDYARFAIMGTLVYDALTGLTVGPLFFHQSFLSSLIGQIPFTAFHLLGNTIFALILSPAIYNFMIKKKKKESVSIISLLNPKII